MTAAIVDEMTDTPSDRNRECKGQGIANIGAGLLGGMEMCIRDSIQVVRKPPLFSISFLMRPVQRWGE